MGSDSGPLLIGLTGGIASGKSTVCQLFAQLGIAIVDADVIAREVVAPGSPGLAEIERRFGAEVLAADGGLDRGKMRTLVFAEPEQRRRLESITHPRIRQQMWRQALAADSVYVILAVPLLVEGGLHQAVDRVLVVDVCEQVQRNRLAARDRSSPEQIEQLLAAQTSADARLAVADDVIDNNGDLAALSDQVSELHRRYLDLAQNAAEVSGEDE